jgi:hypothetical protein
VDLGELFYCSPAIFRLEVDFESDGTVVGAEDVVVDGGGGEFWGEGLGGDPVVDAPADVVAAGAGAVGPPGVGIGFFGVEVAEGVDEAGLDEFGEAGAFFGGEAGAFEVSFGAGEVDFLVGDVEITGGHDGFAFGFEGFEVFAEGDVPFHAIGEAEEFIFGVGGVDGDEEEVGEFEGDDSAFFVAFGAFFAADSEADAEGFGLGEDGGAGVAGFFGGVPVSAVAGEIEGEVDLFGAGFCFLEAEDVRVVFEDEVGEVLFEDGADAVDVPGNEFHGRESGGCWGEGEGI